MHGIVSSAAAARPAGAVDLELLPLPAAACIWYYAEHALPPHAGGGGAGAGRGGSTCGRPRAAYAVPCVLQGPAQHAVRHQLRAGGCRRAGAGQLW